MAERTMIAVDSEVHSMAKAVADSRGMRFQHYTDAILRPTVVADYVALGEATLEPPSYEDLVGFVEMICKKTGETRKECLDRILTKGVLEDFADKCCPAEAKLAAVS